MKPIILETTSGIFVPLCDVKQISTKLFDTEDAIVSKMKDIASGVGSPIYLLTYDDTIYCVDLARQFNYKVLSESIDYISHDATLYYLTRKWLKVRKNA